MRNSTSYALLYHQKSRKSICFRKYMRTFNKNRLICHIFGRVARLLQLLQASNACHHSRRSTLYFGPSRYRQLTLVCLHGTQKENIYASTATIVYDRNSDAWQMNLTLPPFPVCPEVCPRIKSATEEMLAFWEEVRGELSDDGQWWSEAEAPPPKAERRK